MQLHFFKLRFRKRLRRGQKQAEGFGLQAEAGLEKYFLRRITNLGQVWRFVTGWTVLVLLLAGCLVAQIEGLSNHYQTTQPVAGGVYTEGMVGTFTNANPLYATGEVDTAVSKLLFAGLFTYDQNNQLVGDLADKWQANELGTTYTVHLKPNLVWQDGQPLTANDVVFTYQAIQNPDAQSPFASSWQGIKVTATDAQTIIFTLPNPLSSFPYTLTSGIIPEHAFKSINPSDWRSAAFNTSKPVGAGPFTWSALQVQGGGSDDAQTLIALDPFTHYQGGAPKLTSFVMHVFNNLDSLQKSFQQHELTAASLSTPSAALTSDNSLTQYDFTVSAATMAFFNTEKPVISDVKVRQALVQATDVNHIIDDLGFPTRPVREPLLKGQIGYDASLAQPGYDLTTAKKLLDDAGWKLGTNGLRTKDGKPLIIDLIAPNSSEYQRVGTQLTQYWKALGVRSDFRADSSQDFQTAINNRSYDVVLNSIAIGVDPDVFAYWDSSQTDPRSPRLNLSQYKSATADTALEAGRTRLDPSLRAAKYHAFLEAWKQDVPALGLYQPHYLYLSHGPVYGLQSGNINVSTDRFNNVQNWMIRTAKVSN